MRSFPQKKSQVSEQVRFPDSFCISLSRVCRAITCPSVLQLSGLHASLKCNFPSHKLCIFLYFSRFLPRSVPVTLLLSPKFPFWGDQNSHFDNNSPSLPLRALKNIVFVNFIFNNKKSTSLKSSFGGFSKFCLNGLYAKSDYFLSINFMILLRFTANIAIAPCISMPIRPDDDATS